MEQKSQTDGPWTTGDPKMYFGGRTNLKKKPLKRKFKDNIQNKNLCFSWKI
jgi:hypothetical protein